MQKVPVEFGEWRPDIALLDTKFASEVENVFAGMNSYLPFPSLLPFTMRQRCRRRLAACMPRAPSMAAGKSSPAPNRALCLGPCRLDRYQPHDRRRL